MQTPTHCVKRSSEWTAGAPKKLHQRSLMYVERKSHLRHTGGWHLVYLALGGWPFTSSSPTPSVPSASAFSLRFLPHIPSNPYLRPLPSVWITSGPSSNPARPILCTRIVIRHRMTQHHELPCGVPAERSLKILGSITARTLGWAHLPYMGIGPIRQAAPSTNSGKISSWPMSHEYSSCE